MTISQYVVSPYKPQGHTNSGSQTTYASSYDNNIELFLWLDAQLPGVVIIFHLFLGRYILSLGLSCNDNVQNCYGLNVEYMEAQIK